MTAPATTSVPSPNESVVEFTLRAAVAGLLFGLLFGAANAYLGLRALLGGMLGIAGMIPLRRLLIVKSADELPYPEGTACAAVLRATTARATGGQWIFLGLVVGALLKLLLGGLALLPSELAAAG